MILSLFFEFGVLTNAATVDQSLVSFFSGALLIEKPAESIENNQVLSLQLVESVKSYLVTAGISSSRLSVEGFGESMPVASNTTAIGKAQNRRVELVVKE